MDNRTILRFSVAALFLSGILALPFTQVQAESVVNKSTVRKVVFMAKIKHKGMHVIVTQGRDKKLSAQLWGNTYLLATCKSSKIATDGSKMDFQCSNSKISLLLNAITSTRGSQTDVPKPKISYKLGTHAKQVALLDIETDALRRL